MDEGTSSTTRTPRRRAWLVLGATALAGALSFGGVRLWHWMYGPAELRVVAKYTSTRIVACDWATSPAGFAIPDGGARDRTGCYEWSGRELWHIDDQPMDWAGNIRASALSPDGRWLAQVSLDPDKITVFHDGRKAWQRVIDVTPYQVFEVSDRGTVWLMYSTTDELFVAALSADRAREGRADYRVPSPSGRTTDPGMPAAGKAEPSGDPDGCRLWYPVERFHVSQDDRTLVIEARDPVPYERRLIHPRWITYRVEFLPNRLELVRTAADATTKYGRPSDGLLRPVDNAVTAPDAPTWSVPAARHVDLLAQTDDGRFAVAALTKVTAASPLMYDIEVWWAAMRRAPVPSFDPDCALDICVYERPGILRSRATLSFGRLPRFEPCGVAIAPDGQAALVQVEGAVHLLRW